MHIRFRTDWTKQWGGIDLIQQAGLTTPQDGLAGPPNPPMGIELMTADQAWSAQPAPTTDSEAASGVPFEVEYRSVKNAKRRQQILWGLVLIVMIVCGLSVGMGIAMMPAALLASIMPWALLVATTTAFVALVRYRMAHEFEEIDRRCLWLTPAGEYLGWLLTLLCSPIIFAMIRGAFWVDDRLPQRKAITRSIQKEPRLQGDPVPRAPSMQSSAETSQKQARILLAATLVFITIAVTGYGLTRSLTLLP